MSTRRLVPFPNPESVSTPSATFLDISSGLLERGYRVRFRAEGWSMHPTIRDSEVITIASVAPSEIRKGDIILYRYRRGVVAHRVVRIEREARATPMLVLRGDAADRCDAPVAPEQVLGQVLAVDRAGRRIDLAGRWARVRRLLRLCGSRLKGALVVTNLARRSS